HPRRRSLAAFFRTPQRAREGDLSERARLDREEAPWKALDCTLDYNKRLREAPEPRGPKRTAKAKGGRPYAKELSEGYSALCRSPVNSSAGMHLGAGSRSDVGADRLSVPVSFLPSR